MTNEVYAFVAAIICGILAVVFWTLTEALRNAINAKAVLNGILDVLWWIGVCVVFSICMWQILNLRVRFFEFVGVGIGVFLCHITLKKTLNYIFGLIFEIILKIFQFIFKILLTPWAFLYKILIVDKLSKSRLKQREVAEDDSHQK